MQLTLSSNIDSRLLWAFAVDTRPPKTKMTPRRPKRELSRYVITSCSKQLKELGVSVGMKYSEAIALVPNIRVITYGR